MGNSDDKDKDGFISFEEFSGPKGESESEEKGVPLPIIFKAIDEDGDVKISKQELAKYFAGQSHEKPVTDEEIDEIMKTEDKDGDGFLSYEEFSRGKGEHEEL